MTMYGSVAAPVFATLPSLAQFNAARVALRLAVANGGPRRGLEAALDPR